MALELRPAHDPTKQYGFAGVVISTADLSASIWVWHRDGDRGGFAATSSSAAGAVGRSLSECTATSMRRS